MKLNKFTEEVANKTVAAGIPFPFLRHWESGTKLMQVLSPENIDDADIISAHYVPEAHSQVECNRQLATGGKFGFSYTGECVFCALNAEAKATGDMKRFNEYKHNLNANLVVIVEEDERDKEGRPTGKRVKALKMFGASIKDLFFNNAKGFGKMLKRINNEQGGLRKVLLSLGDGILMPGKELDAKSQKAKLPKEAEDLSAYKPMSYEEGVAKYNEVKNPQAPTSSDEKSPAKGGTTAPAEEYENTDEIPF